MSIAATGFESDRVTKPSCKRQYIFNKKMLSFSTMQKALIDDHPAETKSVIEEGRRLLNTKQDHIKIAGKYGWETL